jgi:hypothetical protein
MAPHPHYSKSPDAKLIELAEQIVADQAAREAIPDDQDLSEATRRLFDLVEKLTQMKPRTPAGLRAKARAAVAIGAVHGSFESNGKTDDLAWAVVADAARDLPG